MPDMSDENFAVLGALMSPQDIAVGSHRIRMFPAELKVVLADTGEQMIGTPLKCHSTASTSSPSARGRFRDDGADRLTKPGPFSARTMSSGTFLGIRVGGNLCREWPANG